MSALDGCPIIGAECGACGKGDTFNTSLLEEIESLSAKIVIHCRYCNEPLMILNPDDPEGDAPAPPRYKIQRDELLGAAKAFADCMESEYGTDGPLRGSWWSSARAAETFAGLRAAIAECGGDRK